MFASRVTLSSLHFSMWSIWLLRVLILGSFTILLSSDLAAHDPAQRGSHSSPGWQSEVLRMRDARSTKHPDPSDGQ
jgi:hypothetical protein